MPWTEITRVENDGSDLRYARDCRDEAWELIAPIVGIRAKVGRFRMVDIRAVWDAIQHMATSGCQWRPLPKDFPPVSTVWYYFFRFRAVFSLEQAVHRMTGLPAKVFGLRNRGLIKKNAAADIVLFSDTEIADRATAENPKQKSDGIELVYVNGKCVKSARGKFLQPDNQVQLDTRNNSASTGLIS